MDRESDMAEGDMGMHKSSENIHPPRKGNQRGSRKDRRNREKGEIRKGAKRDESLQGQ